MNMRFIWLITTALFILSIWLQSQIYLDWDLLYTLEGGRRLLNGGDYLRDLFDTNPPLIFYLGMGVVYLAQKIALNAPLLFKVMTYLILVYSMTLMNYLLNPRPRLSRDDLRPYLLPSLAFCLFILPVYAFGEREHLMIALVLPYFFLRFQSSFAPTKAVFSRPLRILISVLAGVGFALKPHFLFAFLFSEGLLAFSATALVGQTNKNFVAITPHPPCGHLLPIPGEKGKKKFSSFSLEPWIVVLFQCGYWLSIAVWMPSYYQHALPMTLQYYVPNSDLGYILFGNFALFSTALLLGISLFLPKPILKINQFMGALSLGFTCSYLFQAKGWFYQALPLFTINTLWMAILNRQLFAFMKQNDRYPILFTLICGFFLVGILEPSVHAYREQIAARRQNQYSPWINLVKSQANNAPIYFFSTMMRSNVPITYYSGTQWASRFSCLWLLAGIVNKENALKSCDAPCQQAKDQLRQYVVEDFKRYHPKLVFVEDTRQMPDINAYFDYLAFMQKSLEFASLWKQYAYLKTEGQYAVYKLLAKDKNF